ncbi:CinA family protein [Vogesella sp. LIG4]|uniref:CinA family protein n=1 Tax=Vogesella sp. LIG4 TaxID=1192162 RepID=UPI000B5AD199|nr:nicotinamide-nucleotide amidohydrolase family protein [Vogesella sp. LIG4]
MDKWQLAAQLGTRLAACGQRVTTAESCTGGGVAAAITEIAGSSGWFDMAVVSYSDEIKQRVLGVPAALLQQHGAVSEPVAAAMAEGALRLAGADWALAVSGVAGPGGGTAAKPVGMVCFAIAGAALASPLTWTQHFAGDRHAVREQSVCALLSTLLQQLPAQ